MPHRGEGRRRQDRPVDDRPPRSRPAAAAHHRRLRSPTPSCARSMRGRASSSCRFYPTDTDNGVTAMTEAMAMGKAVICTRVDGQRDVLEHGVNGLFVPPPESPGASRGHRISEPPQECERMGREGRENRTESHPGQVRGGGEARRVERGDREGSQSNRRIPSSRICNPASRVPHPESDGRPRRGALIGMESGMPVDSDRIRMRDSDSRSTSDYAARRAPPRTTARPGARCQNPAHP